MAVRILAPLGIRRARADAPTESSGWVHPSPARGRVLGAGEGGKGAALAEGAAAISRRSRQKENDGAVWAGGEEPAQQLYVSRVSVPYGSSALTHRADSPASTGVGRGDSQGPRPHRSEGLLGGKLAHEHHCEYSQPQQGTPQVTWV